MEVDNYAPNEGQAPSPSDALQPKLQLPWSVKPPSTANPPQPLVWLIFGATGHMGRSVAKAALNHNDPVCAVGRTHFNTMDSMAAWHSDSNRYMGTLCDVRVPDTVANVVESCIAHFGRLDVVANCSGFGVIGACEDQDEYEIRDQFETNFMGTLNIIQATLPYFREHNRGRYLIFSSTSGALGVPGLGPYCATKYAVEGLIESMLYEVDQFNIKATLVAPGHIRRDELPDPMADRLPPFGHFLVKPASEPYLSPSAPAAHAKRILHWIGTNQPTSVVKAAELTWQLAHCSFPPLRLLLGSYTVDSIRDRLRSIIEEIEEWKHLHFPPMEQDTPMSSKDESKEEKDEDQDEKGEGDEKDAGEANDEDKMEDEG